MGCRSEKGAPRLDYRSARWGGDRSATVAVVPQIIDILRHRGYSFVTVGELLELE
ncbi:MAG: hypothetical protein KAU94_02760 [Verrucomicrobia bacterium]|nr:hypothetical protein [Verrucomicrobiota bacterium]